MDDISWSDPAPRGRRAAELEPPSWLHAQEPESAPAPRRAAAPEPLPARRSAVSEAAPVRRTAPVEDLRASGGFRVSDYLGEFGDAASAGSVDEPEVIDYTGALDDEDIWGPRPKLLADEPGGRRTVVITGRVGDRHLTPRSAGRASVPVHARSGFQADRTAMWAVLLCVIVLLAAVASH